MGFQRTYEELKPGSKIVLTQWQYGSFQRTYEELKPHRSKE